QGTELVFTTGGAQSNHAMLTAAAANKVGLKAILILKKRGVTACLGNQLLEKLMGTEVIFMDTDDYADIYAEMDAMGERLGIAYYKIPCGGSNALGTLGYVDCAREISHQGMHFDHIVCAEGSGGTMAGLALGAKLFLPQSRVHGMMVDSDPFDVITLNLMGGAAQLLEANVAIDASNYDLRDMTGPGYAKPSPEGNAAVSLMAEKEGHFLDPVYTGKAFAGLIAMAKEGAFKPEDNVLFVHTGGAGGLFAVME
ncbi:MAG: pyridoxal-phosphate dependent enzyme, partial [Clostridia bacterium]|nr:pyridoxal-phosphate dependent enzyme [Clostridia bacterium]